MAANEWTQLRVSASRFALEEISAVMSMLDCGIMVEDYSDISLESVYGDFIDESILQADKERIAVSIFIPQEKDVSNYTDFLNERFLALGIEAEIELLQLNEKDWEHSWKKYYKPVHIGRVTILPMWEEYSHSDREIIVRMDPGMAFGTGTHETTRLVISLMQKHIKRGDRVLDIGCGSGILSICAAKLGAKFCAAYDIDPMAVRVAKENIRESGEQNIICEVSDLLSAVKQVEGGFSLIAANIVADILIKLTPDISPYMSEDGLFILSGIISGSREKVEKALAENGFILVDRQEENGWWALAAKIGQQKIQ